MPDLKAEKNGVGMGEVEDNQKVSKIRGACAWISEDGSVTWSVLFD